MKEDLELKDLGQYYGTTQYYNIMGVNITDGVEYIMKNGYSWFVTDTIAVIKNKAQIQKEEFLSINLKIDSDKKAVMTIGNGNGKILYTQKYEYTDCKRDLNLYFCDNVMMLNKEY